MNKEDFLDKYRFYIGGFLIVLIVAGWIYLFFTKDKTENSDYNSEELTLLKTRVDDLKTQVEGISSQEKVVAAENENKEEVLNEKININTASSKELETISGIGPARAEDIIIYREANGGFATISEIQNIKGIGPATFEKMRDQITVE